MATTYALYYMPHTDSGGQTGLSLFAHYKKAGSTASPGWLTKHGLDAASLQSGSFKSKLPQATNVVLESQSAFESFVPMEVVATAASTKAMLAKSKSATGGVLFFPTNRSLQIKMQEAIPQLWADGASLSRVVALRSVAIPIAACLIHPARGQAALRRS